MSDAVLPAGWLTFLSNDALRPGVNWSTLGPPMAAGLAARGATVVRPTAWGPHTPREWLRDARSVRAARATFWMQLSARPEWPIAATLAATVGRRRGMYVIDPWPYALDRIVTSARLARVDVLGVTFREAYDRLRAEHPSLPVVHLPFACDTSVFHPHGGLDRDVFAFWMGRAHPPLFHALERYCAARGLRFVGSQGGAIKNPQELGSMVARSRYFVVTPPDLDHPERAGGFSPLVMRYLEGLAAGARLIGVLPGSGEFEAVLPRDAMLEVAPDGSDLERRLDDDRARDDLDGVIERAAGIVRSEHSWDARAATAARLMAAG